MNTTIKQLSDRARNAAQLGDWITVKTLSHKILATDKNSAEGYFLAGLAARSTQQQHEAFHAFASALELDPTRYDAAVELAKLYIQFNRHKESFQILEEYQGLLAKSPLYLEMAGEIYSRLGLHAKAFPLFQRANQLQPEITQFQTNLASCSVYLGRIYEAEKLYSGLLKKFPNHQRHHYELSRLKKAKDKSHINWMKSILASNNLHHEKNIFLYYALGKELEDLEQWEDAFYYYQLAGNSAANIANYDVHTDVAVIDKIIETCNQQWLTVEDKDKTHHTTEKIPIFVVGLPRTGTTLAERIIASHSQVESADETFFISMALHRLSGYLGGGAMNPKIIDLAAKKDIKQLAEYYLNSIDYRLSGQKYFIDKLPENFLYLGFITKAFPKAKIVHVRRNPMDACFAMFKQSSFRYAYTLDDLGEYYLAYDRLHMHWRKLLGDKVIELQYEALVSDPEAQTRGLLQKLELEFEHTCLEFDKNTSPSATASAAQVREKIHSRSVLKWKYFEKHLQRLKAKLESGGITID